MCSIREEIKRIPTTAVARVLRVSRNTVCRWPRMAAEVWLAASIVHEVESRICELFLAYAQMPVTVTADQIG